MLGKDVRERVREGGTQSSPTLRNFSTMLYSFWLIPVVQCWYKCECVYTTYLLERLEVPLLGLTI